MSLAILDLWEHVRIAGRVPDLLEPELNQGLASRLAAHVERCPRCARRLERLERAERMLARMPRALFPLEAAAADAARGRLSTLALWREPAPRPAAAGYGALPAASALAMAVLVLALSATAPEWGSVMVGDLGASTTVASVMPDAAYYPMTLR